jgi:translation initiation factor 3 subunit F
MILSTTNLPLHHALPQVLIHEYYCRETQNPVHVTVTPSRSGVSVKAYVSTPFGVPGKTKGTMFSPVTCLNKGGGYEQELVGLKACMAASGIEKGRPVSYESEVDMLLSMTNQCTENIAVLLKFIDDCILNSGSPVSSSSINCNEIGRQLMSMVEGLAPFGDDEEQLNTNLKDLLMVIYLSNLTKTQLMLNEKLSLL